MTQHPSGCLSYSSSALHLPVAIIGVNSGTKCTTPRLESW
ncbi:MAG: hypothetical protein OJF55_002319 [Rhodanobacteraceae bacterium]|nr:MAG: hypothetical protein OJF55_002319 [Rhodanobacteraceae bacterium]